MESKLIEIVNRLREVEGDGLVSVILAGTAVAAPGNAKPSDHHLLVVTRTLNFDDLKRLTSPLRWWESAGFPRATCFTRSEFESSLDVFPIEFLEVQRAYRVLFGEDLFANATVSHAQLRFLAEYELRGKFLRLRSLYLHASDDSQRLSRLMTDSVVSFVQYLRVIPELFGEEAPLSRVGVVRRVGELLKIDSGPLIRVLRMRDETTTLFGIEIQEVFESYLECLESMIEAVDRI